MVTATHSGSVFTDDVSIAGQVAVEDVRPSRGRYGWIIRNARHYMAIPQIQAALDDLGRQASFIAGSRRGWRF